MKDKRPRLKGNRLKAMERLDRKESRVLVIGDLHCPFDLDQYFDFCKTVYAEQNCNQVVFIGDVIDNHYSSFHEADPDGLGGGDELDLAINRLARWAKEFPVAKVIIGNHDRIIMRKAHASDVPSRWIKDFKDVLETPHWDFVMRHVIDGVQYLHGEGGKAHIRARKDLMSTVQGHIHSEQFVQWLRGLDSKLMAVQVGCGVDKNNYAMAYAKEGPPMAIGCAVIVGGHTGINFSL